MDITDKQPNKNANWETSENPVREVSPKNKVTVVKKLMCSKPSTEGR